MGFPGVLTTLDDFDRADAPTLGANWQTATGAIGLEVFSNAAAVDESVTDDQFSIWAPAEFAVNQSAWAVLRLSSLGYLAYSRRVWLAFRCPNALAADGYRVVVELVYIDEETGDRIVATLERIGVGEIDSQITTLTQLLDGEFIGVDAVGDTFTLYHGTDAASAVALATFTDAGIAAGGYIGAGFSITLA